MIFDEIGLPSDNGSTDKQDSARLAGLMTVFEWPQKVNLCKYIYLDAFSGTAKYVRHPKEFKYTFSRDQFIPLAAGLYVQGYTDMVDKKFIDGKDLFSPSQNGHVRICKGLKPRWYQKQWLWLDVLYSCFYNPMAEPNQLLCMLMVNPDKKFLKFWLKYNKHWRDAIKEYWSEKAGAWRNEPELAVHMIKVLEKE